MLNKRQDLPKIKSNLRESLCRRCATSVSIESIVDKQSKCAISTLNWRRATESIFPKAIPETVVILGNRTGHFARECRNNFGGGRGFGGKRESFVIFTIQNLSFGVMIGQKCYKCNRVGHLARDCQEQDERCYRCNDVGHKSRDCNREKDQISCYNCKEVGHLVKDCPTKIDVCFSCNLEGHISRKRIFGMTSFAGS